MTIPNMTGVCEIQAGKMHVPGLVSNKRDVIFKTLVRLGLIRAPEETVEQVSKLAAAGAELSSMVHKFSIAEVDAALAQTDAKMEQRAQFKAQLYREGLLEPRHPWSR